MAFIVVREEAQDSYVKSPVARHALSLMERIRAAGLPVLYYPSSGASKQLQKALGSVPKPFAAVFLGSDECEQQKVQVKVLDEQTQNTCSWKDLENELMTLASKATSTAPPASK